MGKTTLALSLSLACTACGGEPITVLPEGQGGPQRFSSASKILAHLESKTLTMDGASIPSHPNGFDENVNFGQATQCYHKVTMRPLGGKISVTSQLGTLTGAPSPGDQGVCDRSAMSSELGFDSTAVLIENVKDNGACFDFTVTYPGFGQEGRGSLSEDGTALVLELFFKDQAIGHRCADGNPGDPTVVLNQTPFTGNARQAYRVE